MMGDDDRAMMMMIRSARVSCRRQSAHNPNGSAGASEI